jgi:hypothetical protein
MLLEQDELLEDLEKGVGRLGQQSRTMHDEAQLHKVHMNVSLAESPPIAFASTYSIARFIVCVLQRLLDDIDGDIDAAGASLRVEARHAAKVERSNLMSDLLEHQGQDMATLQR